MGGTMDRSEMKAMMREVLVELLQEQRPSSVELGRNASGTVTIAVKEYDEHVDAAYARAKAIFDQASQDLPYNKIK